MFQLSQRSTSSLRKRQCALCVKKSSQVLIRENKLASNRALYSRPLMAPIKEIRLPPPQISTAGISASSQNGLIRKRALHTLAKRKDAPQNSTAELRQNSADLHSTRPHIVLRSTTSTAPSPSPSVGRSVPKFYVKNNHFYKEWKKLFPEFAKLDEEPRPHILLIDAANLIFRSHFAMTQLKNGAIYGFSKQLLFLTENFPFTHAGIFFEGSRKSNFRRKIFPEYKSNRGELDPDLVAQFPLFPQIAHKFMIHGVRVDGYEADDLIASMVKKATEKDFLVSIISSDKDLAQLVSPTCNLVDIFSRRVYGKNEVFEKFGVLPEKMAVHLSLIGDRGDNIPGVAGIGPKSSAKLLEEFGSLDSIMSQAKLREKEGFGKTKIDTLLKKMVGNDEIVERNLELIALVKDIEMPDLQEFARRGIEKKNLISFLQQNELHSLVPRIAKLKVL